MNRKHYLLAAGLISLSGLSAALPAAAMEKPLILKILDDENEPDPIPDGYWDNSGSDYSDNNSNSEPDPLSQPAAATPYIIVDSYEYGSDSVSSGQTFDLNISFKNTSNQLPVENIIMSIETEEGLSITSSSNTFYIPYLAPLASGSQTIKLKALGSEKSSSPAVSIAFRYEYVDNNTRSSQTSEEKISIPVVEPDRFEVTAPVINEPAFVGEETVLSFQYVNKGKGTLNNVSATVEGNVDTLVPVMNLGNFESGKSGQIDVVVIPKETGNLKVKVKIQYENASGEPVTQSWPVELDVMEMAMDEPVMTDPEPEPENENSDSWIIWVLLAAATVIALIFAFIRKKKKKQNGSDSDSAYQWLYEDAFKNREQTDKDDTDHHEMG